MEIRIRLLNDKAIVPTYQTDGAAGADLHACLDEPVTLQPGERALIPHGFAMALPRGYEAQVRSRSGLAAKQGIAVLNSPGTVDSDYRGEVMTILINHGQEPFTVNHGDRVSQMVVAQYETASFQTVTDLDATDRGAGGFGSTNV